MVQLHWDSIIDDLSYLQADANFNSYHLEDICFIWLFLHECNFSQFLLGWPY
jgi:hypothetical protein